MGGREEDVIQMEEGKNTQRDTAHTHTHGRTLAGMRARGSHSERVAQAKKKAKPVQAHTCKKWWRGKGKKQKRDDSTIGYEKEKKLQSHAKQKQIRV